MKYDKIINIHNITITITRISPSEGVSCGNAGVVVVVIAPHGEAEERRKTSETVS